MSGRSRKPKTSEFEKVVTPKKIERASTSVLSSSSFSRERSASPLNISRNEEKDELAHLNDRLASYIDYVRKLERDKEILTRRVSTITEERLSKVDDARKTYEKEISSLRRLVDDLAKQKAAADVELKKHKDDALDAKSKLSKRDAELRVLQRRLEGLERDLSGYKQDHERYQQLRPEYDALEKKYQTVRKDLEAETVLRTDLENRVAGLREELDFKNRLYDEERSKLVQRTMTVEEEVEDRKAAEYENRLSDEILLFRQQTADELQEYRIQMESTFETKLEQLRQANTEASKDAGKLRDDLHLMRKESDELRHTLAQKSGEVDLLKRRHIDLETLLNKEREDYESQLGKEREEIKRLQAELELRFAEFTDLMNTKVALDQEILMYRKMLEGEESRLNIVSPSRSSVFKNIGKKRRLDTADDDEEGFETSAGSSSRYAFRVSTSAVSDIEFTADQDGSGKWIKLTNTSKNQDVNIGNWVMRHQADGQEVTFKFHRTVAIKPGGTCTVWSSDTDTTHNPPVDIVMKNQNFNAGANITITLFNGDEEKQASCMIIRERTRAALPTKRTRSANGKSESRCSMM